MKPKYLLLLQAFCFFNMLALSSCKKFLDEKPSKGSSVVINSTADLNALLNYYNDFYLEADNVAIYGTDDNGFSAQLYAAKPFVFSNTEIQFSLWDIANLPQTDQSSFSGDNFWTNEYKKIFLSNLVLANVEGVSGTAAEKAIIKADAHLIRAYSFWQLANTYCLPYTAANSNEPGLPLQLQPDYNVMPRASLAATYSQIEADLNEALKSEVSLVQNGVARNWRASKAAANGFAARYYLNRNDYTKALEFANASLSIYSRLVDYNTEMRYGNPGTSDVNGQLVSIKFPYTHDRNPQSDPTDAIGWKELLYYRLLVNPNSWYIPSQELIGLYDQNTDLRFKYHMIQDFSYQKGFNNPALSYPGYIFFSNDGIPEGPTVAEMVLIKAECLARNGDASAAMTAVNQLYVKRTLTGTPPLAAASPAAAITSILMERRREMPFTQRWFDIRRFNSNTDPNDDVSLSKSFFPYSANSVNTSAALINYSLLKGSRRFASPIPFKDVNDSNGLIPQNSY